VWLAVPAALIAPEAAWRLDRRDLVEIEIEDGLQGVAGGAITGGFGQRLEPVAVFGLQRDQFGDGVVPALRPAAAIRRPTVSDYRLPGVARPIARLALCTGERSLPLRFTSPHHDLLYSVT
jgi:hypothetical protein